MLLFARTQIDDLLAEIDAVRMGQEDEKCPRVFVILPADKSSWSRVEKIERASLFTKNMQLFFLCRKFLEDIKPGLQLLQQQQQPRVNVTSIPNLHGHECSEGIDIKQPRVRTNIPVSYFRPIPCCASVVIYHADSPLMLLFLVSPEHYVLYFLI